MRLVVKAKALEKIRHYEPVVFVGRDFIIKSRTVKAHYRRLPNGKTIYIGQHTDKRNAAKRNSEKFKNKVVYADEKETHFVNHKGEIKKYPHQKFNELSQDDIHAQLNRGMPVDQGLAQKVFMTENGITDMNDYLDALIGDEKNKADALGKKPEFTNRPDAMKWLQKNKIKATLKDLQQTYGEVTTPAKAATKMVNGRSRLAEHFQDAEENEGLPEEHRTIAHMANRHAEKAIESQEAEMASIEAAKRATPDDCPEIQSMSSKLQFFGHQAQSLAQLNMLKKAIVDVDMGGGKGLILPADAMALMSQGKVKKPLIVVPGATLEQNAAKTLEYTEGKMNVFLISNQVMNEQFDRDPEKLQEAIQKAPPNTIFMASYDIFAYQDRRNQDENEPEEDRFERAEAMGGAGFDYIALDESHNIKNVQSKRFKAMQHMTHIQYKRVASGTFLSNNPKDVLGQMLFLHPHMSISENDFEKKYGREESAKGIKWDRNKLKQLRSDLQNLGMISLRRSAWIHLLPKREEKLSVVKLDKMHERVHEGVLNEVMDELEKEMRKDARLRRLLESDDEIDGDEELPPSVLGPLNLLQAITDHPHELAVQMKEALADVKEMRAKHKAGELDDEEYAEMEQMRIALSRLSPMVRKAVQSLEGVVSPKAHDVYDKIEEHFKDKKNGKFMVFVQRKNSANHIINNMPEKWKKHAMYFDASKMNDLPSFTQDPNGPKILVAVDASIKEGMNMQIANAQYRYDHHYSPGNQEQGYARIWRFGQDKPAKIHLGIVDGGIDVTKYARLISKLHTNQMVISDMEDDDTFEAYKLSLDNIRNHRGANILSDYTDMNQKILDFQHEENKTLQKKFGSKGFKRSSPKQIGGKDAKQMHGIGPYMSDINYEKTPMPSDSELNDLLGHFRDAHRKLGHPERVFDTGIQDEYLPEIIKIYYRNKARGGGKELLDHTIEQYDSELEHKLTDRERKLIETTLKPMLEGKRHTPHESVKAKDAFEYWRQHLKLPKNKEAEKAAIEDIGLLSNWVKKNKVDLENLGQDSRGSERGIENHKELEKFWDQHEKKFGVAMSNKHKKLVNNVVGMLQEVSGGWPKIKHQYEDTFGLEDGEE
jgi:SNF2 family DNA or RNA helicase